MKSAAINLADRLRQIPHVDYIRPGHTPSCDGCAIGLAADRIEELERERDEALARLREEIMDSYDSLSATRKARYKGPVDYVDSVLASEAREKQQ